MKALLAGLFLAACATAPLAAQTNPVSAKFFVDGGAEFGGDELLEVTFTDGGTQKMYLGQGGYISAGGEFRMAGLEKYFLRASLGYKYTTTAADNVDLTLTRMPATLLLNMMADKDIRIGAGITTHLSPKFSGGGVTDNINFTSSVGTRFEAAYMGLGVQATFMKYSLPGGRDFSANSIGFSYSHVF